MSTPTFIPGYLGTVTINSEDISAIGSVFRINLGRNVVAKKHFGGADTDRVAGKRDVTFSAQGNVSAEQVEALNTMAESADPIAFSLQLGEASGSTDAGVYSGDCLVSNLVLEASADGDVTWSLDAAAHGTVTYTPAGS